MSRLPILFLMILNIVKAEIPISEELIISLAGKDNPTSLKIQAKSIQSQLEKGLDLEGYSTNLTLSGLHKTSKEAPYLAFAETLRKNQNIMITAKKKFPLGLTLNGGIGYDHRRSLFSNSINNFHTFVGEAGVELNLLKNIFGHIDRARIHRNSLKEDYAKILKNIELVHFKTQLRRWYWELMKNHFSLDISNSLLKTAKSQLKQAKKRFNNSVADRSEVARYQSQVAGRKGQILYLRFLQEQLFTQLKDRLPSLTGKKLILAEKSRDQMIVNALSCVDSIKKRREIPIKDTFYDEMSSVIFEKGKFDEKLAKSHSGPDLNLRYNVSSKGVGLNQSDSFDDGFGSKRIGHEVYLGLTISLGQNSKANELKKIKLAKIHSISELSRYKNMIATKHEFMQRSIVHLIDVMQQQKISNGAQKIRVNAVKKKYRQGRVSVTDMIVDEDALLQSELDILDTQLVIVENLLDYFSTFPQYLCPFNLFASKR
ncbi:TolC family protein [Bacteriovoracaceae bacterium]|nr:TolC family protein [Bacteriovoracaceae bacterium]